MKTTHTMCLGVVLIGMQVLTGCKIWHQYVASDPWAFEEIKPHDVTVDENNKKWVEIFGNNSEWSIDVKVTPSPKVAGFMKKFVDAQNMLVAFDGKFKSGLSGIKHYRMVGEEGANVYCLHYNVLSLDIRERQVKPIAAYVSRSSNQAIASVWDGEISAEMELFDPQNTLKLNLTVNANVKNLDDESQVKSVLIEKAAQKLVRRIVQRYTPPAIVTRMRGDGLFAEIGLRRDTGVKPGMKVEFYCFEERDNPLKGKKERQEVVLGTGKVCDDRFVGEKTTWVKIDNFDRHRVLLYDFARLLSEN